MTVRGVIAEFESEPDSDSDSDSDADAAAQAFTLLDEKRGISVKIPIFAE